MSCNMTIFNKLNEIRTSVGQKVTTGLSDEVINEFAQRDKNLKEAVDAAYEAYTELTSVHPQIMALDEVEQIKTMQKGIVNFYNEDVVNPFVPLAARGPWIITTKGAVIHDNGGYGMLAFGHTPGPVIEAMGNPQVMANIMTASFSQQRFITALKNEVGHSRNECPYSGFLFLNSGSEVVTVGARISDINARLATDQGGQYEGKGIKHVALKGSFHGRTDRPSQYSDSTLRTCQKYLASYKNRDNLLTVEPNNLEQLQQVFEQATAEGTYIESMFMEPVMGEGNPGQAISREFYDLARQLTEQHGSLLLVDSIQAGLRAHGCLSIVDYPGFKGIEPPDMETWSKALNAGQYPFSVLAMTEKTKNLYQKGVYGNTMTTNPRSLDIATQVLSMITPKVRENIQQKGEMLVTRLKELANELGGLITSVQGTGLLVSCELHPECKCFGKHSIEEIMRQQGLGVIHGGKNSLRFTPHFTITSEEIELIITAVRQALQSKSQTEAS